MLHDIEELLEVYYNSGQFVKSVRLLERYYESPFEMYRQMGVYYRERDYFAIKHNRLERFRILLDFFVELHKPSGEEQSCFKEALTWDCYTKENLKKRPEWLGNISVDKKTQLQYLKEEHLENKYVNILYFKYDWLNWTEDQPFPKRQLYYKGMLFDYQNRDVLTAEATVTETSLQI